MGVIRYLVNVVTGLWTILKGLRLTLKHFFWVSRIRRPVTMQYPDEKDEHLKSVYRWKLPERFRGLIWADLSKCIVCGSCARTCPLDCIVVEGKKVEGRKGKQPTRFEINISRCLFCGLCEESCPTNAMYFRRDYELACYSRKDMLYQLVGGGEVAGERDRDEGGSTAGEEAT